jgi:hypothetical protein
MTDILPHITDALLQSDDAGDTVACVWVSYRFWPWLENILLFSDGLFLERADLGDELDFLVELVPTA